MPLFTRTGRADYTPEAEALFGAFAERHGLVHDVDEKAPVEVLWNFPAQPKLSLPITLGLQNGDELNFGVERFWSYLFPFEKKVAGFETMIEAWMRGDARVIYHARSETLEILEGDAWTKVYGAFHLQLRRNSNVGMILRNDPSFEG